MQRLLQLFSVLLVMAMFVTPAFAQDGDEPFNDCAEDVADAAKDAAKAHAGTIAQKHQAMRQACKAFRQCKGSCRAGKRECKGDARASKKSCKAECRGKKGRAKRACKSKCRAGKKVDKRACKKAMRGCKRKCRGEHKSRGCKDARKEFWSALKAAGQDVLAEAGPSCKDAYDL